MKRKLSPAQEETLRAHRFKPGVSPNPGGISEKREIRRAYRELLAKPWPKDRRKSWAEAIALAVMTKAAEGDVAAARECADRTEGKPVAEVSVQQSHGEVYTLRSFRDMTDEQLDAHLAECQAVLKRSAEWEKARAQAERERTQ